VQGLSIITASQCSVIVRAFLFVYKLSVVKGVFFWDAWISTFFCC